MTVKINLVVDGTARTVEAAEDKPLLYVLRDAFELNNPKFGCGLAQCGACTVIIDGEAVRSCSVPVGGLDGAKVRTLGALGTPDHPHPVQKAFIDESVPFCGYCINGWMMTAVAMLEKKPRRTDEEIRDGLSGLKCRCGSHMAIMRAVKRASNVME
jgi:aerobic-type carbon monoxide dehydrogenase small subunit (CoxS/CutS family)